MKRMCALGCGHKVGQGDRHAKFACPPRAGHHGEHHKAKLITRRLRRKETSDEQKPGFRTAAVMGTRGSKAKTHRAGRKAAKGIDAKAV